MKCIEEGSYNLMFAGSLTVILIFLTLSAYLYDKSRKAVDEMITRDEIVSAKAVTMISMILSTVAIVMLFIVFFAMKKVQQCDVRPSAPPMNGVF